MKTGQAASCGVSVVCLEYKQTIALRVRQDNETLGRYREKSTT